jgi:hypothetical protein
MMHLGGMEWSFLVNVHFPPTAFSYSRLIVVSHGLHLNEYMKYCGGDACEPHTVLKA